MAATKTACLLADLMLHYWRENGWKVRKHVKPNGEKTVAEVDFENHIVNLYPHSRHDGPVGRTILHEGFHVVFEVYNDLHPKILPLEKLVWRGLDKPRRDAFNLLAEEE